MSKNTTEGKNKTRATRKKKISEDESDLNVTKPTECTLKKKAKSNDENDTKTAALKTRKKVKTNNEDDTRNTEPIAPKPKKNTKSNDLTTKPLASRKKAKSDNENNTAKATSLNLKEEEICGDENDLLTTKKSAPKSKKRKSDENDSEIAKIAAPKSKKKQKSSDENDTAIRKPKSRKTKTEAAKDNSDVEGDKVEEVKLKSIIIKGRAPVDPECTEKVGIAHVYTKGDDIYDAMLNQTNLQNNNNKYYIIQLLEDDKQKSYDVWFRWGRVGKKGQTTLVSCGSNLEAALKTFKKKFFEKTKNQWDDKLSFQKVSGKYDLLHMDYNVEDEKQKIVKITVKEEIKQMESKLHKRIKNLIELICDVKAMEEAVMEMQYDAKKAPLGKLTTNQIKAGYLALKKIEKCIAENKTSGSELLEACNEFYTRIPHDFGMKRPPLITSHSELKTKILLLEALGDIQTALTMIKEEVQNNEHPADRHYQSLCCELKPLEKSNENYKIIEQYLQNTHAKTHNQYKLELIDVFECNKDGESEKFKDVGNRALLWHGSRLTNWAGILKQGLRIAPPEAPVTGYMFGKGVYFADMCSKSANYCFATRQKNEGLLVLCEVSLGSCRELINADHNADKLPKGKHSVKGLGSIIPNPKSEIFLSDGVRVPLGKSVDSGVKNPNSYTLNYNEYIVYDTSQIRMRYLLRVKFKF